MYATAPSEADQALDRRRRAVLCAYGTATGLLPPPYAQSKTFIERTIRRPDGGGGERLARILHNGIDPKLLTTPTAYSPCIKTALKSLSRLDASQARAAHSIALPRLAEPRAVGDQAASLSSRGSVVDSTHGTLEASAHRPATSCAVVHTSGCPDSTESMPGNGSETANQSSDAPITQVAVASISDPCLSDPMECETLVLHL